MFGCEEDSAVPDADPALANAVGLIKTGFLETFAIGGWFMHTDAHIVKVFANELNFDDLD